MPIEIFDTDYTKYIYLLGTAHFTKRSSSEAINAIKNTKTQDLAIELDIERFNLMNRHCISCPRRENCFSNCEFVAASEALGNTNANIWLIDMSESDMKERMKKLMKPGNFTDQFYVSGIREENFHRLWEQGFKNVVRGFNEKLDEYRRVAPSF